MTAGTACRAGAGTHAAAVARAGHFPVQRQRAGLPPPSGGSPSASPHSDIGVTMTIYAHTSLDEKRQALGKLGNALA